VVGRWIPRVPRTWETPRRAGPVVDAEGPKVLPKQPAAAMVMPPFEHCRRGHFEMAGPARCHRKRRVVEDVGLGEGLERALGLLLGGENGGGGGPRRAGPCTAKWIVLGATGPSRWTFEFGIRPFCGVNLRRRLPRGFDQDLSHGARRVLK